MPVLSFTFVSAFVAHTALADPVANQMGAVIFLVLLAISYFTYHKLATGLPTSAIRTERTARG